MFPSNHSGIKLLNLLLRNSNSCNKLLCVSPISNSYVILISTIFFNIWCYNKSFNQKFETSYKSECDVKSHTCSNVAVQRPRHVPRHKCQSIKRQKCRDVPHVTNDLKCVHVPIQSCQHVPVKITIDVPQETCHQVKYVVCVVSKLVGKH